MSDCKFSDLLIGESVKLTCHDTTCSECGYNKNIFEHTVMTYLGHKEDRGIKMDRFHIDVPIFCVSCGIKIERFQEACGGMYFQFEEVKEELELQHD